VNTFDACFRQIAAMVVMALCIPSAFAGSVTTYEWDNDYDDILNERLAESFVHHVAPAVRWMVAEADGRVVNRDTYGSFQYQFLSSTFAEFVYTYRIDGTEYTRTYFSRSGEDQPRLPSALGPSRHRYTDFVDTGPTEVHAFLSTYNATEISHIPLNDGREHDARRNDAELKAVRSIERDILAGTVPRGGEVTAFVSQRMCESCARAVRLFADLYDATVYVNAPTNIDNWAAFRFMRKRKSFLENARASLPTGFNNKPPGPPSGGPPPPPSCGAIATH
jgi:hypothetical protein